MKTQAAALRAERRWDSLFSLVDISEASILPVSQIFKTVDSHIRWICFRNASLGEAVFLRILSLEMPSQEDDVDDKEHVAAQVGCECDEVPWTIP